MLAKMTSSLCQRTGLRVWDENCPGSKALECKFVHKRENN